MKFTAESDTLVQLTQFGAFNCYLVREDDGLTVIDTAYRGQAQAIMRAAAEAGASNCPHCADACAH